MSGARVLLARALWVKNDWWVNACCTNLGHSSVRVRRQKTALLTDVIEIRLTAINITSGDQRYRQNAEVEWAVNSRLQGRQW